MQPIICCDSKLLLNKGFNLRIYSSKRSMSGIHMGYTGASLRISGGVRASTSGIEAAVLGMPSQAFHNPFLISQFSSYFCLLWLCYNHLSLKTSKPWPLFEYTKLLDLCAFEHSDYYNWSVFSFLGLPVKCCKRCLCLHGKEIYAVSLLILDIQNWTTYSAWLWTKIESLSPRWMMSG